MSERKTLKIIFTHPKGASDEFAKESVLSIKANLNTPFTKVIEEACTELKLTNPTSYKLRLKNLVIDNSKLVKSVRLDFSSKLELFFVSNQNINCGVNFINVAIQIENQQRIINKFENNNTLWTILLYCDLQATSTKKSIFEQSDSLGNWLSPVCVLLNREFTGLEILSTTSLKSLGLNQGSVAIKVTFKTSQIAITSIIDKLTEFKVNYLNSIGKDTLNSEITPAEQLNNAPKGEVELAPKPKEVISTIDAVVPEKAKVVKGTEPIDHNVEIYLPCSTKILSKDLIQVDEEDLKLSASELKQAFAATQSATKKIVEGSPLMTQAMRDAQRDLKVKKHPTTRIKVMFSDGTQFHASFDSNQPFQKLIDVLSEYVDGLEANGQFFAAPPLNKLNPPQFTQSFHKLNMIPASVVHLRSTNPNDNSIKIKEKYLQSATPLPHPNLSTTTSNPKNKEADLELTGPRSNLPQPPKSSSTNTSTKDKFSKFLRLSKPTK